MKILFPGIELLVKEKALKSVRTAIKSTEISVELLAKKSLLW